MPFLKFLVYEETDGHFLDLIAAFKDKKEANEYCARKRTEAKRRRSQVEKDYIVKEWKE